MWAKARGYQAWLNRAAPICSHSHKLCALPSINCSSCSKFIWLPIPFYAKVSKGLNTWYKSGIKQITTLCDTLGTMSDWLGRSRFSPKAPDRGARMKLDDGWTASFLSNQNSPCDLNYLTYVMLKGSKCHIIPKRFKYHAIPKGSKCHVIPKGSNYHAILKGSNCHVIPKGSNCHVIPKGSKCYTKRVQMSCYTKSYVIPKDPIIMSYQRDPIVMSYQKGPIVMSY